MPFLNGRTGMETQWCQIFLFFKEKMDSWIFQIRNLPRFSFGKHWMAKQSKSVAYGLPVGNLQVYFCNRGCWRPPYLTPWGDLPFWDSLSCLLHVSFGSLWRQLCPHRCQVGSAWELEHPSPGCVQCVTQDLICKYPSILTSQMG